MIDLPTTYHSGHSIHRYSRTHDKQGRLVRERSDLGSHMADIAPSLVVAGAPACHRLARLLGDA